MKVGDYGTAYKPGEYRRTVKVLEIVGDQAKCTGLLTPDIAWYPLETIYPKGHPYSSLFLSAQIQFLKDSENS